jgi:hypothetical protein
LSCLPSAGSVIVTGRGSTVLPRLRMETSGRSHVPVWPSSNQHQRMSLFAGRPPYRSLVVLLDDALLSDATLQTWGKTYLLAGLLSLESISSYRYADEGPPSTVDKSSDEFMGEFVPGWAVLAADDGSGSRGVRAVAGTRILDSGISGNLPAVAAADTTAAAYSDLPDTHATEQRRRDALALLVADAIGADLFITERPYLHEKRWGIADGVTVVDLDSALAIVGLYLRSQDTYVTSRNPSGRGTHTMNRGLFFWVGTRELLPAAWRWFTGCLQHSRAGGEERLVFLAQSVLQRVQRALQSRDEVHLALNKPQNNDTADQALAAMDVVLLLLMGAVDAAARVAHSALGMTTDIRLSAWQRKDWMKEVALRAPALYALFQPGADHSHTLTILRLLRNSIHDEAMQPLAVGKPARRDRTLVAIPAADETRLRAAVDALGGTQRGGIESPIPGGLHFDPGVLIEELLPRVLAMLGRIMDKTPVESLAHVSIAQSECVPPTNGGADTFGEVNRQSIRWQLGL